MGSRLEEKREVAFPVADQPAFDLATLRLKGMGRNTYSKDIAWQIKFRLYHQSDEVGASPCLCSATVRFT